MSPVRNIVLAAAAAGALLAGAAAFAEEAKKDEPSAQRHGPHARGEHRGHGMRGMGGMGERCHAGQDKSGEHEHRK
jgi:hypothetical protein